MRSLKSLVAAIALAAAFSAGAAEETAMPHLVSKDGRFALMVDGAPFLVLGGQANNSSNYPSQLPKVWPAIEKMQANTLVMPVAWQQIEPEEGKAQIAKFLTDHTNFFRQPITKEEIYGIRELLNSDGDLRTLPCHFSDQGGTDGFFAARLVKRLAPRCRRRGELLPQPS